MILGDPFQIEDDTDLLELKEHCIGWHPVGSRFTCRPAVVDTDRDFLCLVSNWRVFLLKSVDCGFELGGSIPADRLDIEQARTKFISLKRGTDNLIITDDLVFCDRFLRATRLAKQFNLTDKTDRIALFQAILYER